ncbi:MAG: hypothetical protein WBP70_01765, partial [Terriglobales bacterium]
MSNSSRAIRCSALICSALITAALLLLAAAASAQDWIRTGTGLGVERVRLAAADFKSSTGDPKNADLLKTYN